MNESELTAVMKDAFGLGYRLIDTATNYRNEAAIGSILKEIFTSGSLSREDVFITSKLGIITKYFHLFIFVAPADQGYDKTLRAVNLSLEKLQVDYIDLYLIHWPGTAKLEPSDPANLDNRQASWLALESCVRMGKIRSIGVSNYMLNHLQEMESYADIPPAVIQIELHPAYVPLDVLGYCQNHSIFVQAYASLGEGQLLKAEFLEKHLEFEKIAHKHNCSVAQVLLKWPLQRGWGIIPKSSSVKRLQENINLDGVFLDLGDMEFLNNFHEKESFKVCWDPKIVK